MVWVLDQGIGSMCYKSQGVGVVWFVGVSEKGIGCRGYRNYLGQCIGFVKFKFLYENIFWYIIIKLFEIFYSFVY